jgi:GNAT superfamily N-acetyltransferase
MEIRRADARDASSLQPLLDQLGYPTSLDDVRRNFDALGDGAVFVALEGSLPVAFIALAVRTYFVGGREARIEGLVVDASHRGRGVGAKLLEVAEAWAREQNCPAIALRSNTIRRRAHTFYERAGYSIVKSQYAFQKVL